MILRPKAIALALGVACVQPGEAAAHPNFFIEARAVINVGEDWTLSSVAVEWIFDRTYSLYLGSGLGVDIDQAGALDAAAAEEVVSMHTRGLDKYNWFAFASPEAAETGAWTATDLGAGLESGRVILRFSLSPQARTDLRQSPLVLKLYDPTFVVGLLVAAKDVALVGPSGCALETEAGEGPYAAAAMLDLDVPPDEGVTLAEKLAAPIVVSCR